MPYAFPKNVQSRAYQIRYYASLVVSQKRSKPISQPEAKHDHAYRQGLSHMAHGDSHKQRMGDIGEQTRILPLLPAQRCAFKCNQRPCA